MNIDYKDYIGFYRGVYPEGYCQHLIKQFDEFELNGAGTNRQDSEGISKHLKEDYQIFFNAKNHDLDSLDRKSVV